LHTLDEATRISKEFCAANRVDSDAMHVIVCGDFNAKPASAVYELLSKSEFDLRGDDNLVKSQFEFLHSNDEIESALLEKFRTDVMKRKAAAAAVSSLKLSERPKAIMVTDGADVAEDNDVVAIRTGLSSRPQAAIRTGLSSRPQAAMINDDDDDEGGEVTVGMMCDVVLGLSVLNLLVSCQRR
jgi:hypothetical protein